MYQHSKQCGYTNMKMYIKVMTKIDTYFNDNYRENGELAYTHPAGDVLWVFVEPGNVVP